MRNSVSLQWRKLWDMSLLCCLEAKYLSLGVLLALSIEPSTLADKINLTFKSILCLRVLLTQWTSINTENFELWKFNKFKGKTNAFEFVILYGLVMKEIWNKNSSFLVIHSAIRQLFSRKANGVLFLSFCLSVCLTDCGQFFVTSVTM